MVALPQLTGYAKINVTNWTDSTDMNTTRIESPCISICALDDDDICMGCFRSVDEITRWSQADDSERKAILLASNERAKKNNPFA